MSHNYDAIVIGAGSVGTPLTYFLSKKGLKVLCIEKNPAAGQGQNKAAIGGVRATHSDPAKIKICQRSLDIFSNWQDMTGTDIGWKKGGYCFPVYRDQEEKTLKGILPTQKKYDLKIDWYEADDIKKFVPGINPNGLRGGTFSPEDAQVSPLIFAESVEREAHKLGATFLFNDEVTDLVMENNTIKGVKTKTETFYSPIVVNAAGAYAQKIGAMAGINLPITPDSHEAGISAPIEQFLGPLVVDLRPGPEGKTANFYFSQNHDGGIIFCYTPKILFPGFDRRSTSEFMPIIARRLIELVPRFKNLRIRRLWRGLYPMTPDGVAIVGKAPGVNGFYLNIGFCGQGFMMGPGTGYNLAKYITEGKADIEQDVFDLMSPERDFSVGKTESLK